MRNDSAADICGRRECLAKLIRSFGWMLVAGCDSKPVASETLKPLELRSKSDRLSLVRFSPDGQLLAAGATDGSVFVWSEANGSPTKVDSSRTDPLVSLTWSPDQLLVVTDLRNGFVGWQFGTAESQQVELPGLPTPAVCVAFRPNVKLLEMVIGMRDGSLFFLDRSGTKQLKPDHRGTVKQLAYSPDGRWLISAGADGHVIWRDASTRALFKKLASHDAEISRLRIGPDGLMATGDWNGMIKIWDSSNQKLVREWRQPDGISGLGWLGKTLVSGGWDGAFRLWNVSSGACDQTISTGRPIHDLDVDSASQRIATASLHHSLQVWRLNRATK